MDGAFIRESMSPTGGRKEKSWTSFSTYLILLSNVTAAGNQMILIHLLRCSCQTQPCRHGGLQCDSFDLPGKLNQDPLEVINIIFS
jgi:hypothetical protein